jgi:hypothetical protein
MEADGPRGLANSQSFRIEETDMRSFQVSIATASCTLMLSAGVAFADDLHNIVTPPGFVSIGSTGTSASPGQTGSNVLASCGAIPTPPNSLPVFSIGTGAKSNTGLGSPFSSASNAKVKKYAGNPTSPTVSNGASPNAVAQYDNACAQAAQHAQMP